MSTLYRLWLRFWKRHLYVQLNPTANFYIAPSSNGLNIHYSTLHNQTQVMLFYPKCLRTLREKDGVLYEERCYNLPPRKMLLSSDVFSALDVKYILVYPPKLSRGVAPNAQTPYQLSQKVTYQVDVVYRRHLRRSPSTYTGIFWITDAELFARIQNQLGWVPTETDINQDLPYWVHYAKAART